MGDPHANLRNIPGQLGYQVLTLDGTVLLSSGDLQNRDAFAGSVAKLVNVSGARALPEQYKRLSVYYDTHFYTMCRAGDKIFVVKRKFHAQEPVNA